MNTKLVIGAHRRLFNKSLKDAMASAGVGNMEMARAVGTNPGIISMIANFKHNPTEEQKLKMAIALNVTEDTIFPEGYDAMYRRIAPIKRDAWVEVDTLRLDTPTTLQLEDPNATDEVVGGVENALLRDYIRKMLPSLVERERAILTMRFGLDGGDAYDLESVGAQFNVTRERVRQIEAKALEKLRLHENAKDLVDF